MKICRRIGWIFLDRKENKWRNVIAVKIWKRNNEKKKTYENLTITGKFKGKEESERILSGQNGQVTEKKGDGSH